jgi:hypothetical protein
LNGPTYTKCVWRKNRYNIQEFLFQIFKCFYIEEIREHESYCIIQWTDTNEFQIILQENIRLPPSQKPEINATYTILIDGVRRLGKVLVTGNIKNSSFVF